MIAFLLTLAGGGLSYLTTWLAHRFLHKTVLDVPTDRGMHQTPTPRGGGIGILLAVLPFLIFFHLLPPAFLLGWAIVAAVSFFDDLRSLSVRVRLPVHLFCASLTVWASGLCLAFPAINPVALFLLLLLFVVGFLNIYNFMDGINGITSMETAAICLGLILLDKASGLGGTIGYAAAPLLGASLIFYLFFNRTPAKLFLGDVGSVGIGIFIAFLLLLAVREGVWQAAILPLYYLADGGITLGRRILKGETFWLPHRTHFYQRSALALKSHERVVGWVTLCNGTLIAIAVGSVYFPLLSILAPVAVGLLLWRMDRAAALEP